MVRKLLIISISFILFNLQSVADEKQVRKFVDQVAQNIIEIVKYKDSPTAVKNRKILSVLKANFDILWMSKFVLSKSYKSLSAAQREEYLDLYTYYLLDNYSPILMKYSNEKYNIVKILRSGNKDYDADVNIIRGDGPPLKLRYHIKEDVPGQYQAVDMLVEGVSTVLNQRSEFSHIIQEKGLDELLNNLREKRKLNN